MSALRSAKYVCKIHLKWANLQITLEEKLETITAFTVPENAMLQYNQMPFRLTNALQRSNV